MRTNFLILIITFCSYTAFGQDLNKKNDVFIELLGNGLLGSVNYSRQLTEKPMLEIRAGLGAYGSDPKTYLTIPVSVNYLLNIGSKHTFLFAGLGTTYTEADVRMGLIIDYTEEFRNTRSAAVNFVPSIGYLRYTTKDFSWRISFTPVINTHGFLPSFGLGLGKRF
ncbi:MAG: hypothetical protein EOO45_09010 [Flavobacterium sp.]|nr:MAG: hypothetical protein EOO45_09010 [Flavobacterium sp.]